MSISTPLDRDSHWEFDAYQKLTDFGSIVDHSSKAFANRIFLDPIENDLEPISFRQLEQFVRGYEVFLEQNDIESGNSVALISNNSTAMALQFIALMATGRVFVPINPNCTSDEINYIVGDSKVQAVIYERCVEEKVSFIKESCRIVPMQDAQPFIAQIMTLATDRTTRKSTPGPDTLAEIVYTSGTTGHPKGVMLSHRNLIADLFGIGRLFRFTPEEQFLTIAPLFHNSGQILTTLIPLYCGAKTTVIRPDMGFINFWYYVNRYEPSWTLVMPSHIALMLDRQEAPTKASLRGILCGGAKIERAVQVAFEERFGAPIYSNYGLTETTSVATCAHPNEDDRVSGSVGRPLEINEVKIFKGGREAGPDEVGEVRISGDNVFMGYLNRAELFAEKVQDGWLHTGDLGYKDDNGSLHIVDRIDHMIIVGGENVYPSEIEKFAPELMGISEAVLLSIPERIMGRELVLAYRLSDGESSNEAAWKALLYEKLTNFKVPRRFIDVRELGLNDFPKAQNGKILRKQLQDALEAHLCPRKSKEAKQQEVKGQRIPKELLTLMSKILGISVESITPQTHMDRVPSWDSMNHLRLVIALEQTFGVTLSPVQISNMISVDAILQDLGKHGAI